jgi:hypothetical protein
MPARNAIATRVLAHQRGQALVAQATARGERVGQMMPPMIRRLLTERGRHRHLRHHGGTTAPDQAAVSQDHIRPGPRRLDRRIHPRATGTDDENVGLKLCDGPLHELIFPWAMPVMGRSAPRPK